MELAQQQSQQLTQQQLAYVTILQMNTAELSDYVQELALENPLIEPAEPPAPPPAGEHPLLERLRWLEETDPHNYRPGDIGEEEFDPLMLVGTDGGLEETLRTHLLRQLDAAGLDADLLAAARLLVAWLEDDGYLRVDLPTLKEETGLEEDLLRQAHSALRALDPAGVGAADLSDCLALQLERSGAGEAAVCVARHHLDALAKGNYRSIARALGVPVQTVAEIKEQICSLDPRPGAAFPHDAPTPYCFPDVIVERQGDRLTVRTEEGDAPAFTLNRAYLELLRTSPEPEVRQYLQEKLQQAEFVRQGIQRRKQTLLRCAEILTERQRNFFLYGRQALAPLRMEDVARQLGVHVSTVSRTARAKYLQCSYGLFPLSFFFSQSASAEGTGSLSAVAAQTLLRRLIDEEDRSAPLSDQELCERMRQEGCPVSRRTVAKYREAMNIPNGYARRAR
ncbi:MAG: RNA polymerase factor sigma-54 [Oscillospiraceae bacterium]|nr:RNA polymerase factor sigma-54 [Oscillospiraceae bacterium]